MPSFLKRDDGISSEEDLALDRAEEGRYIFLTRRKKRNNNTTINLIKRWSKSTDNSFLEIGISPSSIGDRKGEKKRRCEMTREG